MPFLLLCLDTFGGLTGSSLEWTSTSGPRVIQPCTCTLGLKWMDTAEIEAKSPKKCEFLRSPVFESD